MWPVGHFEVLGLSFFRDHFVLLDCGHCYCFGGRSNLYSFQAYLGLGILHFYEGFIHFEPHSHLQNVSWSVGFCFHLI